MNINILVRQKIILIFAVQSYSEGLMRKFQISTSIL